MRSAGSDPETITTSGLSYNLQIGISPGNCDVMALMALPLSSGYRQIVDRGVVQQFYSAHINSPYLAQLNSPFYLQQNQDSFYLICVFFFQVVMHSIFDD